MVRRGLATGWELATVKFRNRTIDLVGHHWVAIPRAAPGMKSDG
jgi:hypothetical protein